MSPRELLNDLARAGVTLLVDGGKLIFEAESDEVFTTEHRELWPPTAPSCWPC